MCTVDCEPASQTGCPSGEACRLQDQLTYCGKAGLKGQDQKCNQPSDCQAGYLCVPYLINAYCERICLSDAVCPSGYFCYDVGKALGSTEYGTCE